MSVLRERDILEEIRDLENPFITCIHHSFKDNSNVYFVLDYIPGGDMYDYLQIKKKLPEKDAKFYSAQIVLAFEHLHKANIAYLDLKPENVLIAADGYIKIVDFGSAKKIEKLSFGIVGTTEYLAPEIILAKGYTKAVDWWTLGVFIYEMVEGHSPFFQSTQVSIYDRILSWTPSMMNFSEPLEDLLKHLLEKTPCKRLGNMKNGVNDVKHHKWYDLSWESLYQRTLSPPYVPDATANFSERKNHKLNISRTELFAKEFKKF